MRLVLHRLIRDDLREVLAHYRKEAGEKLSDRFYEEFERLVKKITGNPRRFHYVTETLHRANFPRFPYHLLYRETDREVRILVLRHHKRDPSYGLDRE